MILILQIAAGIILAPLVIVIAGTLLGGICDACGLNSTAGPPATESREIPDKEAETFGYKYFDGAWYDTSNGGFEFKGVREYRGDWW